ncbi:MAG TPA: hypothetical protein VHE61_02300 [Opitutaceae bacterium]|nr:hypothetical protein [Opitutaceae bacterium]
MSRAAVGTGCVCAGLLLAVADLSGCLAYRVVSAPVKVAATAVIVTGEAATAAVKATGKVAVSAFDAAGNVGGGGIDSAARLTQAGMVTFVDSADGTVVRVPWRQGFTLASAGDQARLALARRALDVVRGGAIVYSASHLEGKGADLLGGDVVRLRGGTTSAVPASADTTAAAVLNKT